MSTCEEHGFRPHTVREGLRSSHTLMVESGLSSGAIMLISKARAGRLGSVSWRPIEGEPLTWETAVCCRRGEERDPVVQAAVRSTLNALQEHDQWRP